MKQISSVYPKSGPRVFSQLILGIALMIAAETALSANYRLYVGEMKVLSLGEIHRVAVGNGSMISTSILENGDLLILAEAEGDTELQVWLKDGPVIAHNFYITAQNSTRSASEIRAILGKQPGVKVVQVGKNVVIRGHAGHSASQVIKKVANTYTNVLDLTLPKEADLNEVLGQIPGLNIKSVGGKLIVSGDVSKEDKTYIEGVKEAYPSLIDLTRASEVEATPMVHMRVQITEFSTNALENLGIDWATSFNGPSLGYVEDYDRSKGVSIVDNQSLIALKDGVTSADSTIGYFGIGTLITSTINLAVSTGEALLLASPTLSAKSGGKAEFLAGGEFPIQVPDGQGGTRLEFKEYGVKLDVEPTVGVDGSVVAKVSTEISSIDQSVSAQGVPGLKSRKTTTDVSLKSGETLAISGLVNQEFGEDTDKVKWLGDIPILGHLFRSESFRQSRSDLVIFITPNIFDPSSDEAKARIAVGTELRKKFLESRQSSTDILD